MDTKDSHSFGNYLKKIRLEKGITLDELCSQTKLSRNVAGLIEEGNIAKLPEDVILKGFLKSYSETVGLNAETVIAMYIKEKEMLNPNKIEADAGSPQQPSFNSLIFLLLFVLLFIISGFYFFLTREKEIPTGGSTSGKIVSKEYILEVECIEDTVLTITVDNKASKVFSLARGENLVLKAAEEFQISSDNNCGVTLFIDDKPVENIGQCGKPTQIILP
jgi:transcriptional regulator with XRE-family HTH domain